MATSVFYREWYHHHKLGDWLGSLLKRERYRTHRGWFVLTDTGRSYLIDEAIKSAFCKRIKRMPVERIRVVDLIADTHVSRSTFYRHYTDVYDVMLSCFASYLQPSDIGNDAVYPGPTEDDYNNYVLEGARMVSRYPELYVACVECKDPAFSDAFEHAVNDTAGKGARKMTSVFGYDPERGLLPVSILYPLLIDFTTMVLKGWAKDGCKASPEETARTISLCSGRIVRSLMFPDENDPSY